MTDDAGANGTRTGNNVDSFKNNATCGFQNNAFAYQLPNAVDGAAVASPTG